MRRVLGMRGTVQVTTSGFRQEAAEAFAELAKLVYKGASYAEIYDAVCRTAVSVVPGCDHACVTTMRAGRRTVCEAASDETARRFDHFEGETGEGPCLDAILTEEFELDPDISERTAWPRLAERTLAELPIRGVAGYRIITGEQKVGALNLLSDTPGALTDDSATIGAIVAAFASVALTAATEQRTVESLRNALDSNREIGKAIGILMTTHHISDDDAFAMLREASNRLNVRLGELARQVVDSHESHGASPS